MKRSSYVQQNRTGFNLTLQLPALRWLELNLTAHEMNVRKHGHFLRNLERLNVLRRYKSVVVVKLERQRAELYTAFLVWVCEVC